MIKFKKSKEPVKPTKSQEVDRIEKNEESASDKRESNKVGRSRDDPENDGSI